MMVSGRTPPSRWSCNSTFGARRMSSRVGFIVISSTLPPAPIPSAVILQLVPTRRGCRHTSGTAQRSLRGRGSYDAVDDQGEQVGGFGIGLVVRGGGSDLDGAVEGLLGPVERG